MKVNGTPCLQGRANEAQDLEPIDLVLNLPEGETLPLRLRGQLRRRNSTGALDDRRWAAGSQQPGRLRAKVTELPELGERGHRDTI